MNPRKIRDGAASMNRRQLLQTGGGVAGAMFWPSLLQAGTVSSDAPAKQAIVIFLQGGMSHYESFDPKPLAPAEIRGEFGQISTRLPGVYFSEHLPRLAARADKFNVIRSAYVDSPSHNSSIHQTLTGWSYLNANTESRNRNNLHPGIGSIVAKTCGKRVPGLPPYVTVPHSGQLGRRAYYATAGLLGTAYEPLESGIPPEQSDRPFSGPQNLSLHQQLSKQRVDDRLGLLQALDNSKRYIDVEGLGKYHRIARKMLFQGKAGQAFDLSREPQKQRERYGNHLWGQQAILTRRLAEAGVPFTLLNFTLDQVRGQDWDTHVDSFNLLKNKLLPPMDLAVSTLLDDLEERGMLDTTLVAMFGEFGRTARIDNAAGRNHWDKVFSVMLTGGGLKSGVVVGESTWAGDLPLNRPVHFSDIVATIYRQLGVSTDEIFRDQLDRPIPVLDGGKPIAELL